MSIILIFLQSYVSIKWVITMNYIFSKEIECDGIYFKHAKGKSCEQGKEFHTYHEIILILDGNVELISENLHTPVKSNTIIVVPKETYHQVIIHGDEESYMRCIINFNDSPFLQCSMKKVKLFASDAKTDYLFNVLKENINQANGIILKSALALLTNSLENKSDEFQCRTNNQFINNIVEYIQANLHTNISSKELSQKFNVSVSTLQHSFKNEMQISLHRYILKKRLIVARRLILSGCPAHLAASEIGFNDYSGFYKQYKKMFGTVPSNKIQNNI